LRPIFCPENNPRPLTADGSLSSVGTHPLTRLIAGGNLLATKNQ